ncbi:MAG: acetyl-CoA carboxylase biotin carboxyl carrier protein subunit [Anaerolineales bacterium]|nr:acetyl-CoA carboxylase biotin carboxyl carrier protein subunit [Anaerolineales bacterium]
MAETVLSPLAGVIHSVSVAVGTTVVEDDVLLVIEALKMENELFAPCAGTIREVRVRKGDKVEEDDPLIVID